MKSGSKPGTASSSHRLSGLKRYSSDVVAFIENEMTLPDGSPLVLEPHQRVLLRHCFTPGRDGRLPYTEILWLLPKKSGKTSISAGVVLWVAFCWTRRPRRVIVAANSRDQAVEQVFADCVAAIERNPRLAGACKVRADTITIVDGSTIKAIPCNPRRISGGRPTMVSEDELWQAEDDATLTRVYEELSPDPSQPNSFRLITSHAGYPDSLLSRLFDRGMSGEDVEIFDGPTPEGLITRALGRFFIAYDGALRMAWQNDAWVEDQRGRLTSETFERQVLNRFAKRKEKALTEADIEAAFSSPLRPVGYDEALPPGMVVAAGLDIGVTRDSSAVAIVGLDAESGRYRLLRHGIWVPNPRREVWLPDVAEFLEEAHREIGIHVLCYDPDQAIQMGQEFSGHALRVSQTIVNQTRMVQVLLNTFGQRLIDLYAEAEDLAEHLHNVAIEKLEDGYRLKKPKKSRLIDGVVALALALMGCAEALRLDVEPTVEFSFGSGSGGPTYTTASDRPRTQTGLNPAVEQRLVAAYPAFEDWPSDSEFRSLQVPTPPGFISDEADYRRVIDAQTERKRRESRMALLWERHRPRQPDDPSCTDPEYWALHDLCWLDGGLGDVGGCPVCNSQEGDKEHDS